MVSAYNANGGPEPIAVVGAGYVGLTTAAGFAERGHHVWCIDSDPERIAELRAGEVRISEPGLAEAVEANQQRLHFETAVGPGPALEHARLVFIAVGTPTAASGRADLSQVECVIENTPPSPDHAIVMKSTVPPGTGKILIQQLDSPGPAYVSCPEFLQEGKALDQFRRPDRVIIGTNTHDWAADAVERLHGAPASGAPVIRTDVTSAELIKHGSNLGLATRISYINEIANMCEHMGGDVEAVSHGIGLDPRIGPEFLDAGLGYGGSCLIKDAQALAYAAEQHGYTPHLPAAVLRINETQLARAVAKLRRHCGSLVGRRVAILGVAFKPDTDDIRGATALALADRLRAVGAQVRVCDPRERALQRACVNGEIAEHEAAEDPHAAAAGADACVIATEWDAWQDLDWSEIATAMTGDLVIDGRNCLVPEKVVAAGLVYEGTGRLSATQRGAVAGASGGK